MELYYVFCVCVCILLIFSVGESIVKNAKLNRYVLITFFALSLICGLAPEIQLLSVDVSFNFLLYFALYIYLLFFTRCVKDVLKSMLIACVSLALCVCYNSLNLLQFEFSYIQPYVALCVVFGVTCGLISQKFSVSYCGVFIGVTISELIRSNSYMYYSENRFCLGDLQFLNLIAFTMIFYVVTIFIVSFLKKIKQKRYEKKLKSV